MKLIFLFLVLMSGYIFAQEKNNLHELIKENNISITSELCKRSEELGGGGDIYPYRTINYVFKCLYGAYATP